jgi:hypothetical protein
VHFEFRNFRKSDENKLIFEKTERRVVFFAFYRDSQERAQGTMRAKTSEFVRTSMVRAADLALDRNHVRRTSWNLGGMSNPHCFKRSLVLVHEQDSIVDFLSPRQLTHPVLHTWSSRPSLESGDSEAKTTLDFESQCHSSLLSSYYYWIV